jgi:thioredoxin-like negative regulator of GroEL
VCVCVCMCVCVSTCSHCLQIIWTGQLYDENSVIVIRTADQLDTLIDSQPTPVFIKFFASWCHHCHEVAGDVERLGMQSAFDVPRLFHVAVVDCSLPDNERLVGNFGIRSYPTCVSHFVCERLCVCACVFV